MANASISGRDWVAVVGAEAVYMPPAEITKAMSARLGRDVQLLGHSPHDSSCFHAATYDPVTHTVTIAHRGTANMTNMFTDDIRIFLGADYASLDAVKSGLAFTEKVVKEMIPKLVRENKLKSLPVIVQTGHSLGTFPATIAGARYGHFVRNVDSPGMSAANIAKLQKEPKFKAEHIDNFLSIANPINLVGRQVGNVYRLSRFHPDAYPLVPISDGGITPLEFRREPTGLFDHHGITGMLTTLQKDPDAVVMEYRVSPGLPFIGSPLVREFWDRRIAAMSGSVASPTKMLEDATQVVATSIANKRRDFLTSERLAEVLAAEHPTFTLDEKNAFLAQQIMAGLFGRDASEKFTALLPEPEVQEAFEILDGEAAPRPLSFSSQLESDAPRVKPGADSSGQNLALIMRREIAERERLADEKRKIAGAPYYEQPDAKLPLEIKSLWDFKRGHPNVGVNISLGSVVIGTDLASIVDGVKDAWKWVVVYSENQKEALRIAKDVMSYRSQPSDAKAQEILQRIEKPFFNEEQKRHLRYFAFGENVDHRAEHIHSYFDLSDKYALHAYSESVRAALKVYLAELNAVPLHMVGPAFSAHQKHIAQVVDSGDYSKQRGCYLELLLIEEKNPLLGKIILEGGAEGKLKIKEYRYNKKVAKVDAAYKKLITEYDAKPTEGKRNTIFSIV